MRFILVFVCLLVPFIAKAQVGIYQWQDHSTYNKTVDIIEVEDKIIAASEDALFYYDKKGETLKELSTLDGLAEAGITALNYHKKLKTIIVTYNSGNIDFIVNNEIINLPDLKTSENIKGSKKINSIKIYNDFAFLACDFGILKLNVKKREVADTYLVGENSTNKQILFTAILNDSIYIANSKELFVGDVNNPLLSHYSNWKQVNIDNTIVSDSLLITDFINTTEFILFNTRNTSIYASNKQVKYKNGEFTELPSIHFEITGLKAGENTNYFINGDFFSFYISNNFNDTTQCFNGSDFSVVQTLKDKDDTYWAVSNTKGIIKKNKWDYSFYTPSGPKTKDFANIEYHNNRIWLNHGGRNSNYSPKYSKKMISFLEDNTWRFLDRNDSVLQDFMTTIPDPVRENTQWVAAYGDGLLKFENYIYKEKYNKENSLIKEHLLLPNHYLIADIGFDEENTLWAINNGAAKSIVSYNQENEWNSYSINSITAVNTNINKLEIMKQSGQKWLLLKDNSILVFDEKQEGTKFKKISTLEGGGKLINAEVNCATEDLNGKIWVGTNGGLSLFQSPRDIFSNSNYDASDILVFFDGNWEKLLKGQIIYSIAVDGGNRKWIGTAQGVYLTSPDGKEQLKHFHQDNSPLLSNKVLDIAINNKTGDVFFATDKGLISYNEGVQNLTEKERTVFVYPNPVTPEYSGYITIQGLVLNSDIKIVDIAGRLVFEGKANGNTFVWDGNTHEGKKVSAGTYIVYSLDDVNGDFTAKAKFSVVR